MASLLALLAAVAAGCISGDDPVPADDAVDRKISLFLAKIEEDPGHYPSHAMVAAAYLDKARETGGLEFLALARKHALRSLEIQPNIEAFKAMAKLEGFEHRFERSIEWAEKAAKAATESTADGEIAAILVDAYLGLGRPDEARHVLDSLSEEGFHKEAALGNYLKATGNPAEAERAFMNASEFALRENAGAAQAWAEIMAAGVWIDAGEHHKAVRHLKKAEKTDPGMKALQIHWAEYYEAEGERTIAAERYGSVLERSDDPEIHHRLFRLYKAMGNEDEARKHFDLSEKGFRKILSAGQIFALGPLAQLLCDAGEKLDEAKELSAENLKYKRDAEALATEKCLRSKVK